MICIHCQLDKLENTIDRGIIKIYKCVKGVVISNNQLHTSDKPCDGYKCIKKVNCISEDPKKNYDRFCYTNKYKLIPLSKIKKSKIYLKQEKERKVMIKRKIKELKEELNKLFKELNNI